MKKITHFGQRCAPWVECLPLWHWHKSTKSSSYLEGFPRWPLQPAQRKVKTHRYEKQRSHQIVKTAAQIVTWYIGVMPVPPATIPNSLTWLGLYLKRPCIAHNSIESTITILKRSWKQFYLPMLLKKDTQISEHTLQWSFRSQTLGPLAARYSPSFIRPK